MTDPSTAEHPAAGRMIRNPDPTVYLDASALVKLVVDEPERIALEQHLSARSRRQVTSALARVELLRAARAGRGQ
jgi:uncharacterized protein with PIN domain